MITTRWSDNTSTNLENVLKNLLQVPHDDLPDESIAYTNWKITKEFNENIIAIFNNRPIEYNYIKYSYNQITAGVEPIEDRTTYRDGFIIVYSNGTSINYILNRNSDAMKLLRKMLKYSGKSEILANGFDVGSDFYVWLIRKVYEGDNIIEIESETLGNIYLDTIKGIKGDTVDLLNKVSATGESVINIISTLSFLLESKNLNQIKIDLEYKKHDNIELILSKNKTINATLEKYQGIYTELDEHKKVASLYLLTYVEVLPILVQAYRADISNNNWNSKKNIEFLKKVGADLSSKVNSRILDLENSTK